MLPQLKHRAHNANTLSTEQIAGILRIMRKLGDTNTVRIYVPISEDVRDKFAAKCGDTPMAERIRAMIDDDIAGKPARKKENAK